LTLQKYAFSVKHASLYNDFQHFAMMTKHVVIPSVPCVMAPHFPYIIFPGNVGNEDSLREVYLKLK
jgi:uncharacterized protein YgbK (DUF1537 family)